MNSKDKIEVALRAAAIARDVLEIVDSKSVHFSRSVLCVVALKVQELEKRLKEMAGE